MLRPAAERRNHRFEKSVFQLERFQANLYFPLKTMMRTKNTGFRLMTQIDDIVRRALVSFATQDLNGSWTGRREREAVSLFVFGHLLREVDPTGFLCDPAQIGIEYPVP